MARLNTLPAELFLPISSYLELNDRARLSSTNSAFRSLLAPSVFQSIHFTNKAQVDGLLRATEKYGHCTTHLRFTGQVPIPDDDDDDDDDGEERNREVVKPVLSSAAAALLSGRHTPNLQTVVLKFDFNFNDYDTVWDSNPDALDGNSIYVFDVAEDDDYVEQSETKYLWRALMNEAWAALATNRSVTGLSLPGFVPKRTSTFSTVEFKSFLGRLESLSIKPIGGDNGAGWKINKSFGYVAFMEELDELFFAHAHQLKHLSLKASRQAPIGGTDYNHINLPLSPRHLPALESLTLKNCFVSARLKAFLGAHARTLKALKLRACVASPSASADSPCIWQEFFDGMAAAQPALTELIVDCESNAPLTRDEQYCQPTEGEEEDDEIKQIRQSLDEQDSLMLFGYAYLDDKYGTFYMSPDENVASLKDGSDQRAYENLMEIVTKNAAKSP
ncbi:unnamed protein product [Discula destructiva]